MTVTPKEADLAGPGIGDYAELERVLPSDYEPLLDPLQTMRALYDAKRLIEDRLCAALNLTLVQVPLPPSRAIQVDHASGRGANGPSRACNR
jgi:aspartate--ammonia ligase